MNYWKKKQLQEWANLTGMGDNVLIKRFLNSPVLQENPEWEEKISRMLRMQMSMRVTEPHPFLPAPGNRGNDPAFNAASVIPGRVIGGKGVGEEFRDPLASFLQHKGIFGPAGSGKTVLSLLLSLQAHRQGIAVWWFDSEAEISPLLAQERDVLLLDIRDLKFNPFTPPPGSDALQYVDKVISRFREILYFRDGSVNLTRSVCKMLQRQQGAFSMGDVHRQLLRMKFRVGQRMAQYWETCCNRFADLLSALGATIDVRHGHDLARLLERSVVWQLRGLSDDHLAFLVGSMLVWVENFRSVHYEWELKNLFVFDEVTRISNISREKRADISEPFFYDFVRTCRKRGIGLVVVTQTPALLPHAVLANLSTWYAFKPVDANSTRVIYSSMGMNGEQLDYFMNLAGDRGRMVVVRHPVHHQPFLLQVAHMPVTASPPEAIRQAVEGTRQWLGPVASVAPDDNEPVMENEEKETVERAEIGKRAETPGKPSESGESGQSQPAPAHPYEFSKRCLDYMEAIASSPFLPVSDRDKKEHVSGWTGNKIREELTETGMIRLHHVNLGKRGKRITLTELTGRAWQVLEALQVKAEKPKGNGGFIHRFWQHRILEWAKRKGYKAVIEQALEKKRVDVGVTARERDIRWAFEVIMEGPLEKELSNLRQDIQEGWDKVIFCAEEQRTLDKLKELIKQTPGSEDRNGNEENGEESSEVEDSPKRGNQYQARVAFRRFKEFIS